jgi:signal transduction histidine kinase
VDQSILNTQTLTFDLCPPILYELSFEAAIEWLTDKIAHQHNIPIDFRDDKQKKPLAQDVRVLLFQAVREVLVNAVKHAEAHRIEVNLSRINSSIRISIKDDGIGFDASLERTPMQKEGGFGLFNIRERIISIGGRLDIDSQLQHGTTVRILAPLLSDEMQPK